MEKENDSKIGLKIFISIVITAFFTSFLVFGGLLIYIVKSNPFNIQACVISSFLSPAATADGLNTTSRAGTNIESTENYDHPLLNSEQEKILEKAGISVESLPTTISPEMEACFVEKLGQKRVDEIINGDTPGTLDILRGRQCI